MATRIGIKILFILIACLGTHKLCERQNDGFCLYNVAKANIPKQTQKFQHVDADIIQQPYRYIGKGVQTFAFESEDGKYVLKLFRKPKIHFNKRVIQKRKNKQLKDFSSYQLAYNHLRKETGLLYLHLTQDSKLQTIVIYDKLGRKNFIELNTKAFALQKKADLLYLRLEERIATNSIKKAKEELQKLIDLLRKRIQMGIYDKDPNLKTNFGFIGDEPIQIDFGRFTIDQTNEEITPRLIRITDRLCKWLESRSPELAQFLRESI